MASKIPGAAQWLELEGLFTIAGFGDVVLAGELDWEPGAGPVYLRRLDDVLTMGRPDSRVTWEHTGALADLGAYRA
jgi:hypothetical protein